MAFFLSATSDNSRAFFSFFSGQKAEATGASAFRWLVSSFRHGYVKTII